MKQYQTYFFDLYGTLIDIHTDETMPSLWRAASAYFSTNGAEYTPQELKTAWRAAVDDDLRRIRRGWREREVTVQYPEADIAEVIRKLYRDKGVNADSQMVAKTAWEFRRASTTHLRLYAGAKELLASLKAHGKQVVLLSNAQHLFTVPELEMLGIRDLFDEIFISSDCGVKKPDPVFYYAAIRRMGLHAKDCLMTGNDFECDILAAKAVGMDTFYILSGLSPKERRESFDKDRKTPTMAQCGMDLNAVLRRLH